MSARPLILTVAIIIAAACGDTTGAGYDHPTAADAVVARFTEAGGLVPLQVTLGHVPQVSVYGDGTVIAPAPATDDDGSVFASLLTAALSPDEMQQLLGDLDAAGLLDAPPDYGAPLITDMPVAVVEVTARGASVAHSVYALGLEAESGNLTAPQLEARDRFSAAVGRLLRLPTEAGARPVEPEAYRVYLVGEVADPAADRPVRNWPLGQPRLEEENEQGVRCTLVSGDDLVALRTFAADAPPTTLWRAGGVTYSLLFRPLLPDESGC